MRGVSDHGTTRVAMLPLLLTLLSRSGHAAMLGSEGGSATSSIVIQHAERAPPDLRASLAPPKDSSALEEVEDVGLDELGLQPHVPLAVSPLWDKVHRSFKHHWSAAVTHSAYFGALVARGGLHAWRGRSVLAGLLIKFRLTAFTSEVGESVRPLVDLWKVRAAYAVSWTYVFLDVLLRTADELTLHGQTWRVLRTFIFFSIFHTVATMLIPAFLIHAAVHHSGRAITSFTTDSPQLALLWWVPTAVGLALIPLMPLFDEPIEHLLKWVFSKLWPVRRRRVASDYQALSQRELQKPNEGSSQRAPGQTTRPTPQSHEEPELQRATGKGEPSYSP
jgi:hypothetical protein